MLCIRDDLIERGVTRVDEGVAHADDRLALMVLGAGGAVGLHAEPRGGLQAVQVADEDAVHDDVMPLRRHALVVVDEGAIEVLERRVIGDRHQR